MHRRTRGVIAPLGAAMLTVVCAGGARAQQHAGVMETLPNASLASWVALAAPPGHEGAALDRIASALPGFTRDALGDLVLRRGSGRPRRVVACGLDEASYAVSEITDDGYLRLHGAGNARRGPLWDQFHEGQRILVLGRSGAVPGVVAVRSTHLWRRRGAVEPPATIEDLWVDIGAHTRAEAEALGVSLLAPVLRDWPRWSYGAFVAGPAAADRAGCAAVAAASRGTPEHGETVYVISVQSAFRWAGLSAAIAPLGDVDTLVIASARLLPPDHSSDGPAVTIGEAALPFPQARGLHVGATIAIAPRARFAGTLVESVSGPDAEKYALAVARAAGLRESPPLTVLADADPAPARARRDSLADAASLLGTLTETYGVSEHEGAVRAEILRLMPAWARQRARTDSVGNLVLSLGPDRDTVVFMAHMDEVGFEITGIAGDGTVSLRQRGGFYPSLWEGQPALLHLDGGASARGGMVRGVFVPQERVDTKQPRALTAWFGMDSASLVARGARVGAAITGVKSAARLAASRFTARSIDDRAGCTALLLALRSLDPATLRHKVIFAWSVQEETALGGAAVMADALRGSVRRVYAVDTFVSSDSPLESRRFAFAPLGKGAVVRALDNSSVTPPEEVDRVVALARQARIPLQVGTTNGGNDGSEFVRHGTLDIPISWPLRYSHSPAEVIDLADVVALGRLVTTLATH
ncbi:MAG TPA: M20/M25/M40 family metallo-hydrolase [Gemmatimonadaceae bacterium]|nr:M20/M25/M40 family metallo-hydrolase [Gemmatimonadaceae bacterium]